MMKNDTRLDTVSCTSHILQTSITGKLLNSTHIYGLVCERQFREKEEWGGFLWKNFGGCGIKMEEKGGAPF